MDSLSWEFHVSTLDDSNITEAPKVSDNTSQGEARYPPLLLNTHSYIISICDVSLLVFWFLIAVSVSVTGSDISISVH